MKLLTNDPAIMLHPSTSTKKISLKGSDTVVGGSIIMPTDIKIEATTKSMTRKGMNNKKPISKARLSSEIMKAGMRLVKGVASGAAGKGSFAISRKSVRSFSRTC